MGPDPTRLFFGLFGLGWKSGGLGAVGDCKERVSLSCWGDFTDYHGLHSRRLSSFLGFREAFVSFVCGVGADFGLSQSFAAEGHCGGSAVCELV